MLTWLQFAVCTAVICYAGAKLSYYGDIIAEKTGLGRTWIGVVLMASVTSLPESITGISSVALADVPVVGLTFRATRKTLLLSWDSWGIAAIYVLATVTLYLRR